MALSLETFVITVQVRSDDAAPVPISAVRAALKYSTVVEALETALNASVEAFTVTQKED